jgi:hypothetical protein
VDDETISGQKISLALEKVGLASLICGNDLMAKPFLLIELGVKALMSVMQSQAARAA